MVDALRVTFPLANLLCGLKLARSTYFYQRLRQTRPDKYTQVREVIRTIFEDNYRCYGYRRIDSALRLGGMRVSEKVVRRLMAQERLVVRTPRRRRFSAYAGDPTPAVPNLLNRDFHASAPNTKWLTDLTEIHIPAGKVYVSPIVDCFDGLVVASEYRHQPGCEPWSIPCWITRYGHCDPVSIRLSIRTGARIIAGLRGSAALKMPN